MASTRTLRTSLAIRGALVWVVLASAVPARAESRYTVDLTDGASGVLEVTLESSCSAFPCDFLLPAWNATYQIRDFSQYVSEAHAESKGGQPLELHKVEPSRWRIDSAPAKSVRLRYRVRADRNGPFDASVRADRATLNLGQVLLYPAEGRDQPAYLRFAGVPKEFREALTLPRRGDDYWAPSYDRLIDTPVLLADFKDASFEVAGKTIRVVAHGPGAGSRIGDLKTNARKIAKAAIDLMGDAPFDDYTFVYVFSQRRGGGMEYRDGTMIFAPADCPTCGVDELTAHEFFHLWNVKRLRPRSMEPVDFSRPVPSPSLWFAEGLSSTYARYLLASAGLTPARDLLARIEERINQYQARPARLTQSAEESSIDAWLEGNASYHRPDRSVSYYLKGELIGYLVDLEIRGRTQNRRSLDDVIRSLNANYAQRGLLFDDTATLIDVASDTAESDMTGVFDELVRTAAEIPWDRYLARAGLRLQSTTSARRDSGLSLADPPGRGIVVSYVAPSGAAEKAGFLAGDRLVECDGRLVVSGAEALMEELSSASDKGVVVIVERAGLQVSLRLKAPETQSIVHRVVSLAQVSEAQELVREGWLNRTTADDSSK